MWRHSEMAIRILLLSATDAVLHRLALCLLVRITSPYFYLIDHRLVPVLSLFSVFCCSPTHATQYGHSPYLLSCMCIQIRILICAAQDLHRSAISTQLEGFCGGQCIFPRTAWLTQCSLTLLKLCMAP